MKTGRVKALVWERSEMPSWNGDYHTVPTGYTVRCADENGWKWSGLGSFGYCCTPDAATRAAQADYERRITSALTDSDLLEDMAKGPVPTDECEFRVGQPVHVIPTVAEQDPDELSYVTGIDWEYRRISYRGWNITIATEADIKRGHGATDGYRPEDLRPAALTRYRATTDGRAAPSDEVA